LNPISRLEGAKLEFDWTDETIDVSTIRTPDIILPSIPVTKTSIYKITLHHGKGSEMKCKFSVEFKVGDPYSYEFEQISKKKKSVFKSGETITLAIGVVDSYGNSITVKKRMKWKF